jgi:hypothetical protein
MHLRQKQIELNKQQLMQWKLLKARKVQPKMLIIQQDMLQELQECLQETNCS